VQIQAAIDYISQTFGGGIVQLTPGLYITGAYVTLKTNITLRGEGIGTVLRCSDLSTTMVIDMSTYNYNNLENINIDGTGYTYTSTGMNIINGDNSVGASCKNIVISNITMSASSAGAIYIYAIESIDNLKDCVVTTIAATNSTGGCSIYGYLYCEKISQCRADDITATAPGGAIALSIGFGQCNYITLSIALAMKAAGAATLVKAGYDTCTNITVSESNSAEANAIGFWGCYSMQQNKATAATPYNTCYADAAGLAAVADTAAGGYNS
jgi:hypothetical protein